MKISQTGISLICDFESLKLKAYPDPGTGGEPWTIGYGTTIYPNGEKVKKGDVITKEQAEKFLTYDIGVFENVINKHVNKYLNQNQFDALVSFIYNVGPTKFIKSTLLKKININPEDPLIYTEFQLWNKASGKVLNGLKRRRKSEADLYFQISQEI